MKVPISTGIQAGWTLTRLFKVMFLMLFFAYLLVSIVLTGIEKKDFGIVVKELGEEFYNPLQTAQEYAIEIQGKENIGFLSSLWDFWGFYFNLFKIYIWIWLLFKIVNFFFQSTTSPFMRLGLALCGFFGVQTLYAVWMLNESPMFVFQAFGDIFNGLTHLFGNMSFSEGREPLIETSNECNESLCVI